MRKTLVSLCALVAFTTALPTVQAGTNEVIVTNRGWVSVHPSPTTHSAIIGKLDVGHKAPLIKTYNRWWYEIDFNGRVGFITTNSHFTHMESSNGSVAVNPPPEANKTTTNTTLPPEQKPASQVTGGYATVVTNEQHLPPDVAYDPTVNPLAPLNDSWTHKETAVLNVATSQMGVPYVWGASKDRGGSGFDCSNFTAYVYHHALGYDMSGASRIQAEYVGWRVPKSQIRVGDLMIFDNGGHVGIYAGNGQIIQEGGGLHRVGYLRYTVGSYWYNHLTTVKRMF